MRQKSTWRQALYMIGAIYSGTPPSKDTPERQPSTILWTLYWTPDAFTYVSVQPNTKTPVLSKVDRSPSPNSTYNPLNDLTLVYHFCKIVHHLCKFVAHCANLSQ